MCTPIEWQQSGNLQDQDDRLVLAATCRPSITCIRNDRSGAATNTLSYHALTVPS